MPKLLVHDVWYVNVILGYQNVPSGSLCLYIHPDDIFTLLVESIGFRLVESSCGCEYYWHYKVNDIHDMRKIFPKELLQFVDCIYIGTIV